MKNKKKQLAGNILLTLVIGMYHSVPAFALPSQGTLDNSNAAAISTQGATMSITGKGANNILNWATFSIDKGETVKFTDKSNYLNLVRGVDISRIYGTLSGGGTVYLVNPNGILFGQGARLDNVGSFIASTRNISAINQETFLNNPNDTAAVLGTDSKEMDNKDYYPADSTYLPKITVADIQLTNVPQSATKIILDGPGGVILKNTELLDKMTKVLTRKEGGEIGIGSDTGSVVLTEAQKAKIGLVDGNVAYAFNENPNVLQGYKSISNMNELQSMDMSNLLAEYQVFLGDDVEGRKYMLVNDIDASSFEGYEPILGKGVFEGLGYGIDGLKIKTKSNYAGLYSRFEGNVNNLDLTNIKVESGIYDSEKGYGRTDSTGALAGDYLGNINNVKVTGRIVAHYVSGNSSGASGYRNGIGGIVGTGGSGSSNLGLSEIRNSHNEAHVYRDNALGNDHGGRYGGIAGDFIGRLFNVSNAGDIQIDIGSFGNEVGGIVGRLGGDNNAWNRQKPSSIIGAYNTGNVDGNGYAGGIVGFVGQYAGGNVKIGEVYNTGFVINEETNMGGIIGGGKETSEVMVSVLSGKTLQPAYIKNQQQLATKTTNNIYSPYYGDRTFENFENGVDFGTALTKEEMSGVLKPEMFGIYDTFIIESRSTGTPINPSVDGSGSAGDNSGGNNSGSAGGNTGGSDSGSTGGNTGGNNGSSTGGGTVVPKPDVPSVMPGGNTGGSDSGSTGGNTGGNSGGSTGGKTDNTPLWHFEYKDTTIDTEWKLIESGVVPQGYEGEMMVVMDSTNPERSQLYIKKYNSENQDEKKQQIIEKDFTGIQMPPNYQLEELKKEYYQSLIKSFDKTKTTSELQKEYMNNNIGSYVESLVNVETENKDDKIPASVYKAFLEPVYNSVNARIESISTKEKDLVSLVKNTGNLISQWLPSSYNTNKVVKDGNTKYQLKYQYAMGQNFKADVTWTDSERSHKATMSVNLYGTKESDKMLKNFMTDLSEIGQDAINNAVDELISAGFSDNKLLKSKVEFAHKLADALVDDAQAEALAEEIGGNFQEAVKGEGILFFKKTAQAKLENLVTSKIDNGAKLVEGIKKIKETEQQLNDYQSKYSQMSKNIENYTSGNSNEQLEASYRILQTSLNELKGLCKF